MKNLNNIKNDYIEMLSISNDEKLNKIKDLLISIELNQNIGLEAIGKVKGIINVLDIIFGFDNFEEFQESQCTQERKKYPNSFENKYSLESQSKNLELI